jgi:hypothetical protein
LWWSSCHDFRVPPPNLDRVSHRHDHLERIEQALAVAGYRTLTQDPPMNPDFTDPASVVRAFIHQMHCWQALAGALDANAEARYRPEGGSTLHPEETRVNKLLKLIPPIISDTFLTRQRRSVPPPCHYSIPPEYDPKTEKVVRVVPKTKSQVVVETNRKADYMGGLRQYVLKQQDGVWLIDIVTVTLGTQKRKVTLI